MSSSRADSIHSLDELREYIHATLCEKEDLVPEQFQMRERALVVRGRPCGVQFCLKGPRSVRLGAIWAADQNVLYLYDARGQRYMMLRLAHSVFGADATA
jgi:hypothetical protein